MKTTMTPAKNPIRYLRLEPHSHDGYFHLYVRPEVQQEMGEDIRKDLVISCQGSRHIPDIYGWSIALDVYRLDLYKAEAAVKFLRQLQSKLDKLTAQLGSPQSYAEFVLRIATALGVEGFRCLPKNARDWRDARTMSLADGRYYMEQQCRDWLATQGSERRCA